MKIGMNRLSLFIVLFTISILSITGMYAYALFDVTSVGEIEDDSDKLLDGVLGTAIYTVGSSTYVVAASELEHGIEIIDISDPTSPTSVGRLADDSDKLLAHVSTVAATTIGSSTYVVAAGHGADDGIEIVDVDDPTSPTSVGSFSDTTPNSDGCTTGTVCLDRPNDIAIATIDGNTYAVVAAANDDGIAIIDISTPASPTHVISIVDDAARELEQTYGVAIATIGDSTYVVAIGNIDDGIAIIDISTPASPVYVGELEDGNNTETCSAANGERCLNGPAGVAVETIGGLTYAIVVSEKDSAVTVIDITTPSDPTIVATVYDDAVKELGGAKAVSIATIGDSIYAVVSGSTDNGIEIIHLYTGEPTVTITSSSGSSGDTVGSDTLSYTVTFGLTTNDFTIDDITVTGTANNGSPEASNFAGSGTTYTFDVIRGSSDGTVSVSVAAGKATHTLTGGNDNTASNTYTLTIDTSTTSSTCARHVILGNCGTIAINNDEYQIIDPWSTVPTTEVMVGEPVSITLSTPHNYVAGKINSVSVYTEIFGSAANYELGSHVDYSIMKSDYYVSEPELFQVSGATHRIVQDTDVKNLEMFEVVFTMVFAKPMDTSHIVVETKNMHGIPETIYLGNALKVIERPIELLTYEEKSKFELISEPELKVSLRHGMDPEPDMDMLVVDPEPVVSKVTCGNGTMLKNNICVVDETSFYFFAVSYTHLTLPTNREV